MDENEMFYNADDVSQILHISKASAYKIIRTLNNELKEQNYFVISGRIVKSYFRKRCFYEEVS